MCILESKRHICGASSILRVGACDSQWHYSASELIWRLSCRRNKRNSEGHWTGALDGGLKITWIFIES
jgi:hypothetical protein